MGCDYLKVDIEKQCPNKYTSDLLTGFLSEHKRRGEIVNFKNILMKLTQAANQVEGSNLH